MFRATLIISAVVLAVVVTGCATQPKAAPSAALPGVTEYYQQATAHSVHAFRKPVRDQRGFALRKLAEKADELLAEAGTWDSDARLVSVAEPERPAVKGAVDSFRTSLGDLRTAAQQSDLAALRTHYARALRSYQQINDVLGPAEESR